MGLVFVGLVLVVLKIKVGGVTSMRRGCAEIKYEVPGLVSVTLTHTYFPLLLSEVTLNDAS